MRVLYHTCVYKGHTADSVRSIMGGTSRRVFCDIPTQPNLETKKGPENSPHNSLAPKKQKNIDSLPGFIAREFTQNKASDKFTVGKAQSLWGALASAPSVNMTARQIQSQVQFQFIGQCENGKDFPELEADLHLVEKKSIDHTWVINVSRVMDRDVYVLMQQDSSDVVSNNPFICIKYSYHKIGSQPPIALVHTSTKNHYSRVDFNPDTLKYIQNRCVGGQNSTSEFLTNASVVWRLGVSCYDAWSINRNALETTYPLYCEAPEKITLPAVLKTIDDKLRDIQTQHILKDMLPKHTAVGEAIIDWYNEKIHPSRT